MANFREQLQRINQQDREKDAFIQGLIEEVARLIAARQKIQDELDSSKYLCRKQFEDIKFLEEQSHGLQRSLDRNPFALVLIDGDISPFADNYIERGFEGGHEAARSLRTAVSEYLAAENKDFMLDTEIIIHVKIKAELKLFYNNVHCKHIMFSGSGDNGYAGFLRQYCPTSQEASKVVLIETLPFARQLGELAVKFRTTELGDLFRKNKIDIAKLRRESFRDTSGGQQEGSPPTTYASRLKQTNGTHDKPSADSPKEAVLTVTRVPTAARKIYQNSSGQRVDQPLRLWADYDIVEKLKPKKFCNRFFITHDCPFDDATCYNNHKGTLSADEMAALRFIARSNPCSDLYCDDPDCFSGHRCMHRRNCQRRGNREKPCRFSEEMHTVDVKIARPVDV
ncbi:hypothetical protein H2200_006938 [Cladophialophora chaetospira]|uniref:C3H1-type domain-containing protein n=1 Tax=Cladophialophora chaetospira TaxID=386627 RepID=A0AA38X958_9EURO|nr:hypothetical protein H2200_006938 [Cladophialophora chaetospira]